MALSGLHFLLTTRCVYECDHCFVFGGPQRTEVFTIQKIKEVLAQAKEVPSIRDIFFEGGEPALYFALLQAGIQEAKRCGFQCNLVTNGYWATSRQDAALTLEPLARAGLSGVEVSCDELHGDEEGQRLARTACEAAAALGCKASLATCEIPKGGIDSDNAVRFRGRAATNLAQEVPTKPAKLFDSCPYEELREPERVHVDPEGFVHVCQGLVIGNVFQKRLSSLLCDYEPKQHPIVARLLSGGPVKLAEDFGVDTSAGFADACHLCFVTRRELRERFPEYLAPKGMYESGE
jgi:MoaA/NifB/PqqE/SkfB family radical SAM enzyme